MSVRKAVVSEVKSHPLDGVFKQVIEQVENGKGKRHSQLSSSFMDQPWAHYARMHGVGFLTGQATKKLEEAASRYNLGETDEDEFKHEVLGAIAYAAMAIIHLAESANA